MNYYQYALLLATMVVFCLAAVRANHVATTHLQEQIDGLYMSVQRLLNPVVPDPNQLATSNLQKQIDGLNVSLERLENPVAPDPATTHLQEQVDGLSTSLTLLLTPVTPGPSQRRRLDPTPVSRICLNCEREFVTAEPQKKYCKGACKNSFNRRRHRATKMLAASQALTTQTA